MKSLLPPLLSVVASSSLSTMGCHAFGLPRHDLVIAALVSGLVSALVAFGTFGVVSAKRGTKQRA